MMKKMLLVVLLSLALVVGLPGVAQARGSVANSCIVPATVTAQRYVTGGALVFKISCGNGMSDIDAATVWTNPYVVRFRTAAGEWRQSCRAAGQWFYPYNSGGNSTAVIYPTLRCV